MFQLASDQGHPVAACSLGYFYEKGLGVPINLPKAVEYYQLASDRNDPGGLCNLGYFYEYGIHVE